MMGGIVNQLLAESGVVGGLLDVLRMVMAIAGAVLTVASVVLFFMMTTANTEDKRRNIKKRCLSVFSSLLIIIALIGVLSALRVNFRTIKQDQPDTGGGTGGGSGGGSGGGGMVLDVAFASPTMTISLAEGTDSDGKKYCQMIGSQVNITPSNIKAAEGITVTKVLGFETNSRRDHFGDQSNWFVIDNPNLGVIAGTLKVSFRARYKDTCPADVQIGNYDYREGIKCDYGANNKGCGVAIILRIAFTRDGVESEASVSVNLNFAQGKHVILTPIK